jgi:hypothetical protein
MLARSHGLPLPEVPARGWERDDGAILRNHGVDQAQVTHEPTQIVKYPSRDNHDGYAVGPDLQDGLSDVGIEDTVLGDRPVIVKRQHTEPHHVCPPGVCGILT